MSAILICKCPACDKITSNCIDSTLTQNRVEFDAVRCKTCINKDKKRLYHKRYNALSNRAQHQYNTTWNQTCI